MPFDDPDPGDPHVLVAVELPAGESQPAEMAAALAEEFARLGFDRAQILALFRSRSYALAHTAWIALGDDAVGRIVDEAVAVWGRVACRIEDGSADGDQPPLVGPDGRLRVVE